MADPRPEIRAPLSPEAIAQIGFRTALRGFDIAQVREFLRSIADHVRALQDHNDDLQRRLREAEARADHPVLDENTLMSALGDETARILRSAQEAAAEIRGRAQEHVDRVVQQARDDAEKLTTEAANVLEVRRAAADAEAAEILRTATEEADRLIGDATASATAMTADAEAAATEAVEQAKVERAEVLSDVRRRRRIANTQIEQLRAGRERLLQAYDVVRSTLEHVTAELAVADDEARAVADEVGRRMNAALDPNQADSLAWTPPPPAPAPTPAPAPAEAAVPEAPPSRPHRKKGKGARPPVAVAPVPEPEPAPEPQAAPVVEEPAPAPVAEEPASEPAPVIEEPAPAPVAEEPAPAPVAEQPVPVVDEPEPEPVPVVDERTLEAERRVAARTETCTALEEHLTRRIKRALQDEQNVVLDRLRSVRGTVNADAALGSEADHIASYMAIVEPALADAARAGAAIAGKPIDVPDAVVATVANDLAMELVLPLRRRLDERLHEAAAVGDDQITASDRVSSAYRETKTQRTGRLASEWLVAAWAAGVHAATAAGTPGTWLSDPANPCCTDCDDNGLAGDVPAGTPFPTGHLHPPAHPGCRCIVVPLT